ncbi:MAG: nucleoside 2-deoxyribosyltransferase [Bifidobacteriaceae bacterium]|jgi:hypothetical protein|nr:nucleoside 2-deoxyribosyltransferase [Bifidobacteriaceae bacterium]
MIKIGVTGHQKMPTAAKEYAERIIRGLLARQDGQVVGLTSLAAGADQMFAQLVLEAGGSLDAIIPSAGYETTFTPDDLPVYNALVGRAGHVTVLDFPEPTEEAFMAAGQEVVARSDLVVAVWDGQPAAGYGGTADAVWYAWSLGKPVLNAWPKGVTR